MPLHLTLLLASSDANPCYLFQLVFYSEHLTVIRPMTSESQCLFRASKCPLMGRGREGANVATSFSVV